MVPRRIPKASQLRRSYWCANAVHRRSVVHRAIHGGRRSTARLAEGHARLVVVVEHCTAQRPSTNLKGSSEKYVAVCKKLETAFVDAFNGEWDIDFQVNPPPSVVPGEKFMNADDACAYLRNFSWHTHRDLLLGKQVVDVSTYPPRLHPYPRVGAFEVSYVVIDGDDQVACAPVFSKLVSGTWPNLDKLMARRKGRATRAALATARRRRRGGERAAALEGEADAFARADRASAARRRRRAARATAAEVSAFYVIRSRRRRQGRAREHARQGGGGRSGGHSKTPRASFSGRSRTRSSKARCTPPPPPPPREGGGSVGTKACRAAG